MIAKTLTVFMFLALVALTACSKEEAPKKTDVRPVIAMQVSDSSSFHERRFPGTATATKEVNLSFRVAGPLITKNVSVGDVVRKDDVLARIDPRDYQVNLRNASAQFDETKATLQRAQNDYNRELNIFKQDPGATSQAAVDKKREARDRARAGIKALEASVTSARDALKDTYLRAPYDGTVVATYVDNFEEVQAKQPVIRLLDDSSIEMVVNIPENLISMTPHVRNIHVEFDTFPGRQIPARIKEIGKEATATTRTYPVTLIMDQPDDIKILAGMSGKATGEPPPDTKIETSHEVPLSAIFSPNADEGSFVWVIDPDTKVVARRAVKTGALTDHGIRILDGLAAGEWIATAGVHYLREGQQVRMMDSE